MWQEQLSKRYAKALAKTAGADLAGYYGQLVEINKFVQGNADLKNFLLSPSVSDLDKKDVVTVLTKDEHLQNFILLLMSKSRLVLLPRIVSAYKQLVEQETGVKEGIIYTPHEISKQTISKMGEVIAKKLGNKVNFENKIDKSISAGFRVAVGYQIADGTLNNKVKKLKSH